MNNRNNHVTLLRFGVLQPDGTEKLHSAFFDLLSELNVEQRLMVSARLKGEDVHGLVWTPLVDGRRIGRSRLTLGERLQAKGTSLADLLEAIEEDEKQAAAVPQRTEILKPLAVN